MVIFFFSSRRRHTRLQGDWSSDVCSSDLFASGLPVVTSGAGGLREVGGDATLVVEGRDPVGYMQALEGLSDDPDRQEALVERGRARARSYTWQKTAERTAAVYRELL